MRGNDAFIGISTGARARAGRVGFAVFAGSCGGDGHGRDSDAAAPDTEASVGGTPNTGGRAGTGATTGMGATTGTGGEIDAGMDSGVVPEAPTARVTSYSYDDAARLTTAVVGTDLGLPPDPQFTFGYDDSSNLVAAARDGKVTSYAYSPAGTTRAGTCDDNGSPTKLDGRHYTWDAENRLASIATSRQQTAFTYDAWSRAVRVVETAGGNVVADRAYTYCGQTRCLEHDNLRDGSPVVKRYFSQGVVEDGAARYYTTDLLGSVHQLVDPDGKLRAQYDYDPYGAVTKVDGDADSDFTYAGLVHHAPLA